ncbi:MAG TPA: ATP-binding protein [Ktedonosporobacter sp.]|nr:ATP-binding protein [Ktedonosporobacter sp.]
MEIFATKRLTLGYLRKLSGYNYIATAIATLMTFFSASWMLFQLSGASTTATIAMWGYAVAELLGAIWIFQAVYMAYYGAVRLERRHRVGWLLIGLAQAVVALGGVYVNSQPSLSLDPTPADFFFLPAYPLFLLGLSVMFSSTRFRLRTALDALIITLCLLGVAWFFVIGPAFLTQQGTAVSLLHLLKLAIVFAYPFGDLLLLLTLLLLIKNGIAKVVRLSVGLIVLGLIMSVWADGAYAYTLIFTRTYHSGTAYIDPFWIVTALLVGLAALYQYNALARRAYSEQMHPSRRVTASDPETRNDSANNTWRQFQHLLVFLTYIINLGLIITGFTTRNEALTRPLIVLAIFIGSLILLRQWQATSEHEMLLKEREQRYRDAERLQYMVTQLTEEHDLARLRELVVRMATTEMEFKAAMLLLAETYRQPLPPQTHLFVNAASKSIQAKQWRLQGDNILYRTTRTTETIKVMWSTQLAGIPEEILTWGREEGIHALTFFPLIYQDKILGSLGFAGSAPSQLSNREQGIARSYAEQVATVIEHALLYQAARDHANFAGALVNVATRLNAAVAEPAEISQLICQEGAKVLNADYAVLYITGDDGILTPMSAFMSPPMLSREEEQEPPLALTDWPTFHISEYDTLVNHTQLPTLFDIVQPTPSPPPERRSRVTRPLPPDEISSSRQQIQSIRQKLLQQGVYTAILAPLIAGGKAIGILILARSIATERDNKRSFDIADLPDVQDFVKRVAIGFHNAQLYQHIQSANQQLQELDHLKDQFMITASHELRTPLTAVQGYIELMAQYDEVLPVEQRREFLQKAQRGCEELVLLLGHVMDASRLEMEAALIAAQIQAVSLQEEIDDLLVLIEPQITQEKREVSVQLPAQVFVYVDPIRFRQVLMNISVNALKYSQPGTPLAIAAHESVEQGQVVISISDKGKGIAPEDQTHLFQRFVRLERDVNSPIRGSGLGLYISRRLLEAMGGKIWLESQGIPGEGSTFHIQLPMA